MVSMLYSTADEMQIKISLTDDCGIHWIWVRTGSDEPFLHGATTTQILAGSSTGAADGLSGRYHYPQRLRAGRNVAKDRDRSDGFFSHRYRFHLFYLLVPAGHGRARISSGMGVLHHVGLLWNRSNLFGPEV